MVAVNTHGLAGYQSETECIFTGVPPTIQVDSPNGAEIYTTDQDFDILWSITDGQFHAWNTWGQLVIEQTEKHFIDVKSYLRDTKDMLKTNHDPILDEIENVSNRKR